jgi:hypothetical protein
VQVTWWPLAAKHRISNPKTQAAVESSRGAKFLGVVRARGDGKDLREFLQAMLDPFFAVLRSFRKQERPPDAAGDAVIPPTNRSIDQARTGHRHWSVSVIAG